MTGKLRRRGRRAAASALVALVAATSACSSSGIAAPLQVSGASPNGTASSGATVSVPVIIARGPGGLRVPLVSVSVGGGPAIRVSLDTGSIGLVVRSSALGSAAHPTGRPFARQYGGFAVRGQLDTAEVSLLGGTRALSTPQISVAAVGSPINTFLTAVGAVGILGIAPGQFDATQPLLLSPLAQLPGSLADGYLLDVRASRLLIGRPSETGAARIALTKASWTNPNGLAGYEKGFQGSWTVGGRTTKLLTLFDTGGREGSYGANLLMPAAVSGTQLQSGVMVRLAVGGRGVLAFTAGGSAAPTPVIAAGQQYMNTGLPAFDDARIGLDQRAGQLVVDPY